jgi:glycogen operon protein
VVWDISSHPELAGVKMIAEPWDCAGLNQVGSFGGNVWARWNDHFRDDVRKFVRGDGGAVRGLATRLSGSSDLFHRDDGRPAQNVNFFTCHDGFPLIDLFTYEAKLNLANREDNRDGNDDNKGWNCGVEGPTDDPKVLALRRRLSKNAMAILMMSIGVPMMLGGDEMLRTQQGNNNAYCQDNEISWFDWSLVEKNADMLEFVRRLIRIRQAPRPEELLNLSLGEQLRKAKIRWHGTKLRHADWTDHSRCLSVTITPALREVVFHAIFNGSEYDLDFELPRPPKAEKCWRRLVDTAQPPGQDATLGTDAAEIREGSYRASARSVVLLAGRLVKEA